MSAEQMRAAILRVYPGNEKIEGLPPRQVVIMYHQMVGSGLIPV